MSMMIYATCQQRQAHAMAHASCNSL
jgi:hypothetical protein